VTLQAPLIDRRSPAEIAQQLKQLLSTYLPKSFPSPDAIPDQGVHAALMAAFVRHAELIVQRLNQVPDKNMLAFLSLLGASQLPPQPARVPLTFFLAQGSTIDAVVPAGTSVATASSGGAAIAFETDQELIVTATQFVSVLARDPGSDRFSDYSSIIQTINNSGIAAFAGHQQIVHSLSISTPDLFKYPSIQQLGLYVQLKQDIANPDPRQLQWEIEDSQTRMLLTLTKDVTQNLTANRPQNAPASAPDIVFSPAEATSQLIQTSPTSELRVRLLTPILPVVERQINAVRANFPDQSIYQLPEIQSLQLQAKVGRSQLPIDAAFSNQIPIHLQQPFFPFGEKPRFSDTVYFACREGFAFAGATVTLQIDVADPALTGTTAPQPPTTPRQPRTNPGSQPAVNPTLQWEFWDGQSWVILGNSNRDGSTPGAGVSDFLDGTHAFTLPGPNSVQFTFPKQAAPAALIVNGISSFWVRARITAGDYGREAQLIQISPVPPATTPSFLLQPATFVPPLINAVTVDYSLTTAPVTPQQVVITNDFVTQTIAQNQTFSPFQPAEDTHPSLYLGFQPPSGQPFPNRPLSLYVAIAEMLYGGSATELNNESQIVWEYWNGNHWTMLTVKDETHGLSHSGHVQFLVPADFAPRQEFGIQQYWLRLVSSGFSDATMPRIQQIILNTISATQSTTLPVEILGSSQGTAHQVFRTTQAAVLSGQIVEVRDDTQPSQEVWLEWQEVPDFYGSGVGDRHYTLNHLTGEITFGDGLSGAIPALGANNVRIHYRTGGGAAGNCPAGSVVELKTTIPLIDRVSNPAPATGGADAESLDALKQRTPRSLRHGGRAVTVEDYEDLALLASPAVARARCFPARRNPLPQNPFPVPSGHVNVVIIPQTTDPKPFPSLALVEQVQHYLEANAIPTASIVVTGPVYVQVSITAAIALQRLDNVREIDQALQQRLTRFLHPLTGGFDGKGWIFGREPHKSDLYSLLESVPGVDHIHSLNITQTEDITNAKRSDRFLIYSGTHSLTYQLAIQ